MFPKVTCLLCVNDCQDIDDWEPFPHVNDPVERTGHSTCPRNSSEIPEFMRKTFFSEGRNPRRLILTRCNLPVRAQTPSGLCLRDYMEHTHTPLALSDVAETAN